MPNRLGGGIFLRKIAIKFIEKGQEFFWKKLKNTFKKIKIGRELT